MRAGSSGTSWRDERGQVAIILAALMFLFAAFGVLVVDVGLHIHARRHVQSAVDKAALAGALELPNDVVTAVAMAEEWLSLNGIDTTQPGTTAQFNLLAPARLEVVATRSVPGVFAGLFGIAGLESVTARAVAEGNMGAGAAVFVINNNCGIPNTLQIPGSRIHIIGGVHSNGRAQVNGSDNRFDGLFSYRCSLSVGGQRNVFQWPPMQVGTQPSPLGYQFSDFPCTVMFTQDMSLSSYPPAWVNDDPGTAQLRSGVYCSTHKITLDGSGVTGTVTLASQVAVNISGSNFILTPYWGDVLAFSAGTSNEAIDVSGSGGEWTGYLFAPYGRVKVAGSGNLVMTGGIVGNSVQISGSEFQLSGFGDGGELSVYLVE